MQSNKENRENAVEAAKKGMLTILLINYHKAIIRWLASMGIKFLVAKDKELLLLALS